MRCNQGLVPLYQVARRQTIGEECDSSALQEGVPSKPIKGCATSERYDPSSHQKDLPAKRLSIAKKLSCGNDTYTDRCLC